ncbi:MAG: LON peptidase substrate-binding domain-containing protein [Acidimicrobiales bacterium]|nr:LON peptidase substrate-binding domain-containing protein [Acidimicrobiales bacterium]
MNHLPMFPLGNVIFPLKKFDLRVFENRYLELITDIQDSGGYFGSCLIERGHEVGGGDKRFSTGTYCQVTKLSKIASNQLMVECQGTNKLVVHQWLPEVSYPVANVEYLEERIAHTYKSETKTLIIQELQECYLLMNQLQENQFPSPNFKAFSKLALYELCDIAPLGQMNRYALLACESEPEREDLLLSLVTDERLTLTEIRQLRNHS